MMSVIVWLRNFERQAPKDKQVSNGRSRLCWTVGCSMLSKELRALHEAIVQDFAPIFMFAGESGGST